MLPIMQELMQQIVKEQITAMKSLLQLVHIRLQLLQQEIRQILTLQHLIFLEILLI